MLTRLAQWSVRLKVKMGPYTDDRNLGADSPRSPFTNWPVRVKTLNALRSCSLINYRFTKPDNSSYQMWRFFGESKKTFFRTARPCAGARQRPARIRGPPGARLSSTGCASPKNNSRGDAMTAWLAAVQGTFTQAWPLIQRVTPAAWAVLGAVGGFLVGVRGYRGAFRIRNFTYASIRESLAA